MDLITVLTAINLTLNIFQYTFNTQSCRCVDGNNYIISLESSTNILTLVDTTSDIWVMYIADHLMKIVPYHLGFIYGGLQNSLHPSVCSSTCLSFHLSICLDLTNAVTPWPLSRLICSILSYMESSWPINVQQHGHWPVSLRIIVGHTNPCRCCNIITAGEIHAIFSSVELPLPLNVQCYGPSGSQIHADAATSISLDWFGPNQVPWKCLGSKMGNSKIIGPLSSCRIHVRQPNSWGRCNYLKLFGTIRACRCATAWSLTHWALAFLVIWI